MSSKKTWLLGIPILLGLMLVNISFMPTRSTVRAVANSAPMPILRLPWVSGPYRINGGNSYNCGDHTDQFNDRWAIDFSMPVGSPLAAPFDGTAHTGTMGEKVGIGNFVWIDHGDGWVATLGHIEDGGFKITDGQHVSQGQLVALSGSTGNSTGPHVHFRLRSGATSYNNGTSAQPEPMSGYTGFGGYGACSNQQTSPYYLAGPTPFVKSTRLSVEVSLEGIGTDPIHGGNTNPRDPNRLVEVRAYDIHNNLVVDTWGAVSYYASTGTFLGLVDIGQNFLSGYYLVKIRLHNTLRQEVPCGILKITQGTSNILITQQPSNVELTGGDINDDNVLDILDYNILLDCFHKKSDCTPTLMAASDLNDDGTVNAIDYNIWLRNTARQPPCGA